MFADPCIIVQFTKKIHQDATVYQNFISYLYEAQHVSGETPPIIRSLKLHYQPLVLHTCRVVGRVVAGRWQRPATTRPTTPHVCKTRGCQCSFRLLIMGGVSPETCWASYKYEIKFWYAVASCRIFFVNCTKIRYKKQDLENNSWLYKNEDTLTESVQTH